MKTAIQEIDYRGTKYKLVFDLCVMEEIQDEYGSIDAWGKLTDPETVDEPNVKALVFGVAAMINEGIDIDNDENGTDIKPLTHKKVARILTEVGLNSVTEKMQNAVIESTADDSKNA